MNAKNESRDRENLIPLVKVQNKTSVAITVCLQ